MKKPIISFEHFSFKYNSQESPTLNDINLSIHDGEVVLIAGPSGCGKSTFAHCINGLIPNAFKGEITGSVKICGKEGKDLSIFDRSKQIGTVLQDTDAQFIGLTVGEDIAFSLENDAVPQPDMFRRVRAAAKRVGMAGELSRSPHDLSGGQKQRVSLAGVLVDPVQILLFDEPLANLDPAAGKQTMRLIAQIHRETGLTVIIIEHRLEDVLEIDLDRVILMADGKIVADGPPGRLLASDVLSGYGIREPLYLSALKMAGVHVTEEMHPEHIDTLDINTVRAPLVAWSETAESDPETADQEEVLRLDKIAFHYTEDTMVLRDISFQIKKGECVALVGKNGAGKSTLTRLICGLEKPTAGRIFFHGENLADWTIKERSDRIGLVMQNPNQMLSQQMIYDEVALGLRIRGTAPEEIRQRVYQALKICGLYPYRNWPVSALSFGQKKRVTIASILVMEPELIILDEPTAGQDYRHYTEIMQFLEKLSKRGISLLLITHDMHLMLEYADRAIVLSGGEKTADEPPATLLSDRKRAEEASLKETSLFTLAKRLGLADPITFVEHYIHHEKEVRRKYEHADAQLY
ncbi:ABC transporter ATP-binding protein [Sporolactobacillus sp. THM19-2]|uniref:ABC transporter ATP-binding protein n=1 Tax=Sporolactobacillus sp. THM19-2 TaxID=2511171 RepID=UPI00102269D8|nr:ABC transporter ATP-binding protein [Sporolactobacillus sp. THM19-2]RYL88527.1 ABC transporter ATP-binding protein [Sporolactobacillus sp. THM19-2]